MTVAPQNTRQEYDGNGVSVTFAFPFYIKSYDTLYVYIDGTEQASSTYTASGVGQPNGGNVVFQTAPAMGAKILLLRKTPLEREADYQNSTPIYAQNINTDFDTIWLAIQEIQSNYVALQTTIEDFLSLKDQLEQWKIAAQDSATAAANSATAAATSATAAANSASAAAGSATQAAQVLSDVQAAGTTAVNNINAAETASIAAISNAQSSALSAITNAQTTATSTIANARAGAINDIISERGQAISAIRDAGDDYVQQLDDAYQQSLQSYADAEDLLNDTIRLQPQADLTPQIDGVRTVFDIPTYVTEQSAIWLFWNGQKLTKDKDFTVDTAAHTITMAFPPSVGDDHVLELDYSNLAPNSGGGSGNVYNFENTGNVQFTVVADPSVAGVYDVSANVNIPAPDVPTYTFNDSATVDFTTTTDASGNKTITADVLSAGITGFVKSSDALTTTGSETTILRTLSGNSDRMVYFATTPSSSLGSLVARNGQSTSRRAWINFQVETANPLVSLNAGNYGIQLYTGSASEISPLDYSSKGIYSLLNKTDLSSSALTLFAKPIEWSAFQTMVNAATLPANTYYVFYGENVPNGAWGAFTASTVGNTYSLLEARVSDTLLGGLDTYYTRTAALNTTLSTIDGLISDNAGAITALQTDIPTTYATIANLNADIQAVYTAIGNVVSGSNFKGYAGSSQPPETYDIFDGDLYYATDATEPPTTYPWTGIVTRASGAWGTTTSEYTPHSGDWWTFTNGSSPVTFVYLGYGWQVLYGGGSGGELRVNDPLYITETGALAIRNATTTQVGVSRAATDAEVSAGTDVTAFTSPKQLDTYFVAQSRTINGKVLNVSRGTSGIWQFTNYNSGTTDGTRLYQDQSVVRLGTIAGGANVNSIYFNSSGVTAESKGGTFSATAYSQVNGADDLGGRISLTGTGARIGSSVGNTWQNFLGFSASSLWLQVGDGRTVTATTTGTGMTYSAAFMPADTAWDTLGAQVIPSKAVIDNTFMRKSIAATSAEQLGYSITNNSPNNSFSYVSVGGSYSQSASGDNRALWSATVVSDGSTTARAASIVAQAWAENASGSVMLAGGTPTQQYYVTISSAGSVESGAPTFANKGANALITKQNGLDNFAAKDTLNFRMRNYDATAGTFVGVTDRALVTGEGFYQTQSTGDVLLTTTSTASPYSVSGVQSAADGGGTIFIGRAS